MDKELLTMLVCPLCQGKLKYDREAEELKCHFHGLAFPVRDGIPVMLEEEARLMDTDEKLGKSVVSPTAPSGGIGGDSA
ncbi:MULTISPECIES: Trm112 family protein [Halomonadaceae]|uniref:Trm112 family protein n=1 Tax=Halomonadaceae TaxID=28256 RepID=UPI00159B05CF|nr:MULTISPECIES: Trm112 family protein [unclassified Halomonas]QJQ97187.1 Trm112 family protein [Halomonas sp. PA5]